MAAAPAAAPVDGKAGGGTKKIIIIALAVLALLAALAVGAFALMQKNMASEASEGAEADETVTVTQGKPARNVPPIFVPLEPFIVNLADQNAERFAQIGISLQVDSAKVGEDMKAYMPAIRNEILLLLSRKTADDLMTAEGKTRLAAEIRRGSARAMGYEITEPDAANEIQPGDDVATQARKKRITRIRVDEYNPIINVHYANFIIQ